MPDLARQIAAGRMPLSLEQHQSVDRSKRCEVCVARVIADAIPEIGASTRPASMFAAIRAR
jgi:hypothetical protein